MAKSIDMTNGPLGGKIFRFVLPLAVTGILQQLFNAADVAVVGRFVGTDAMAAVGCNSPIVGLFISLFIGITMGANVVIARFTGQQSERGIRKGVHTSIVFAVIGGIVVGALGILLSKSLLTVMHVDDVIMPMALSYIRIWLAGMPVILLYNFEASIFRSQGDTRTPLICLVTAGITNVLLNLFFVIVLHRTADGVALATVLSNLLSSMMMFVLLLRRTDAIKVRFSDLKISGNVLKEMLKIGVPAGIQGMVFCFSNIIIQSAINSFGPTVVAASSAGFNIEIFVFYLLTSYGQACTTFIGQNYGAGKLDRCREVTKISYLQGIVTVAAASAVVMLFATPLLGIFNGDPDVIMYGRIRVLTLVSAEVVNFTIELLSGALRGFGYSLIPAIITLIGVCTTRILWVFLVLPHSNTFATLMLCYPLSWIATAAIMLVYYLMKRKEMYGLS